MTDLDRIKLLIKNQERINNQKSSAETLKEAGTSSVKAKAAVEANKLPTDKNLTVEHLEKFRLCSDLSGLVLEFDTPADLFLAIVDDITPYRWQYDELRRLGGYGDLKTKQERSPEAPLLYCLKAANGSGKDQVIIAATVMWYLCTAKRSRAVITSFSNRQIVQQTEPWIRWLGALLNKKLGRQYVRSVRMHHAIPEIGSRAELFVTDEANAGEGYHPDPGGRMMLCMNEAKGIVHEVYEATARNSGYDTFMQISSPGRNSGDFYLTCIEADEHPKPLTLGKWWMRKITGFDCPHLPEAQRLAILKAGGGGDTNPLYESSWMAEFSSMSESVVIHDYMVHAAAGVIPKEGKKRFGLDIGSTGDPTILYLVSGTKVIAKIKIQIPDLIVQTERLFAEFINYNFTDAVGFGDHNGLGQGVVDGLRAKGIKITGVYNQSSAQESDRFLNLGAELWFGLKDLITNKVLPIPTDDQELYQQLLSRKYYIKGNGKIQLEAKKEHKKRTGGESPDSADAFVLCFAGTTVATLLSESAEVAPVRYVDPRKYTQPPTSLEILNKIQTAVKKKLTAWDICR